MDIFFLAVLAAVAGYALKTQDERQRMALLSSYLSRYQIEKLMGSLIEGYLRALGEIAPERRDQVWQLLLPNEAQLCEQVSALVTQLAAADPAATRVSTLGFPLPQATRWFPTASFDFREAMRLHAIGITEVAQNKAGLSPRDQAYTMTAELLLMQHTCHWFCKSKPVASMRLLARHKTTYEQVLAGVSARTRNAYSRLIEG